ncbi:arginine--tRNA ligase [Mycoplasma sp. Mirounga ES2805-ORL]|uniref:arginine--tRNA ligase n=1 Tax=Mycoplasma sp. Mirounga ES2805-ORL TaxID=754514 RepID=UPI00197BC697|nr:arginine--tRNA ligase [Mycoplasma sp. Mirounga ES2805-ORL]QSF13923.1 arginine--tRNA ligase [Mycoplasma sp. Mirounga ES2805-ORL]
MNKCEIKEKLLKKLEEIAKKLDIKRKPVLIDSKGHGDLTTNIAMGNSQNPMELAQKIVDEMEPIKEDLFIKELEIAAPGFINFFINQESMVDLLNNVLKKGSDFGKGNKQGNINIEYVSANPTGYLHVGHARNAAIASTVANIVEFAGMNVTREYYINDAGSQINILAESLFARYQQFFDKSYPMPEECYRGTDIVWAAKQMRKRHGDVFKNKKLTGKVLQTFKDEGVELFLQEIKKDCKKFGATFDIFFSERTLYKDDNVVLKDTIKKLGNAFEKDGATWLRTTVHGDDKDRVLIKSNGAPTYFMPDIAYHNIKFTRTNGIVMNVWGADHSGYIKRMECAMQDLGWNKDNLVVLTMQLVRLIKNGEEFKMSKRKGTSFFLRDFAKLVGVDSARFILLDRTYNSKLDFDIDIATSKSNDNPVILVQYANARAYSLLAKTKQIKNKNLKATELTENDQKLILSILEFPEIIMKSADKYVTNLLTQYLIKLAKEFNSWYSNSPKIIGSENEQSMLAIAKAVNIVLENGLKLLGCSIKHKM